MRAYPIMAAYVHARPAAPSSAERANEANTAFQKAFSPKR